MVQELFFEIVRKNQHIFCDAKDNVPVIELKRILEGILKIPCAEQILVRFDEEGNYSEFTLLEDKKTLGDSGFTSLNSKAQNPAVLGLMLKGESHPQVDELSAPPPIPDAMQGNGGHRQGGGGPADREIHVPDG